MDFVALAQPPDHARRRNTMSFLPKALGRYTLLDRIAKGGMGEVYRAIDDTGRLVAVKMLRTDVAAEPNVRKMFAAEARLAQTLQHRNIVRGLDAGTEGGRDYLVMELVDGVDLGQVLKIYAERLRRPMPMPVAVRIAIEALRGLEHAHRSRDGQGASLHVVHRDISPENVLISFDGEVKLADFGVAQSALKGRASLVGAIKGKVLYMAPEQLRGDKLDGRADLYSIGAVLYEMLTRRRLFLTDDWSSIPDILEARYPYPRALNPEIPPRLEEIVLNALSLSTAFREPSAAAMGLALEALAWELGWTDQVSLSTFARDVRRISLESDDAYSPAPTRPARPGSIRPTA